jgi:acyl carrier protein
MSGATPSPKTCPCGCGRPVKPGNSYGGPGCAYKQRRTTAPVKPTAVVVARQDGLPAAVVAAIVDVLGVDEGAITPESRLMDDLGADSLDVAELAMLLERRYRVVLDDQALEWESSVTVAAVIRDLGKAGADLEA